MPPTTLLSLPNDILILLPTHLHTIEDYTAFAATCRRTRACSQYITPATTLRLASAQSRTFFRPAPYFLVAATARELGHWARQSEANERDLATSLETGIDALMTLALEHCGVTLERLREMYELRFSVINPVCDIVDKCVGQQWYAHEDFWNGGVSDAYTIDAAPEESFWHLVIYGELFGPDFEAFLDGESESQSARRRLSVETRLEYIKYVVHDFATTCFDSRWITLPDGSRDQRRTFKDTGPYVKDARGGRPGCRQHNIALTWLIRSSRFRPHWKAMRQLAGPEFQEDLDDGWWYDAGGEQDWKQRMWENVMLCQGLQGMEMMRPGLREGWVGRVRGWREKIASLEREPDVVEVGRQATAEYPFLLGDLRICASGYVSGT